MSLSIYVPVLVLKWRLHNFVCNQVSWRNHFKYTTTTTTTTTTKWQDSRLKQIIAVYLWIPPTSNCQANGIYHWINVYLMNSSFVMIHVTGFTLKKNQPWLMYLKVSNTSFEQKCTFCLHFGYVLGSFIVYLNGCGSGLVYFNYLLQTLLLACNSRSSFI